MTSQHDAVDTITVGPADAEVIGTGNRALQVAVDAMAFRGGGTVRVLAGEYVLDGPVRMRTGVTLQGESGQTVFRRAPLVVSALAVDADIGQRQITPADASAFRPGMGVILRDSENFFPMARMPLTVERVADGVLYTDGYVEHDILAERDGQVATCFPMVHAAEATDFAVEGLVLDGTLADPGPLAGLWGRGLYLRRCHRAMIRDVVSTQHLGDGFGCGQGSHITFEACTSSHNTHYGIHPGSHSPHTRIVDCHVHDNGADGVYLCWGVHHSEVRGCHVHDNGGRLYRNGICTGHKDTDNLIVGNHIHDNAKHGIHVRQKTAANGAHRTTVRDNVIENNGWPWARVPARLKELVPRQELLGHGVYVCGITHDLVFENNVVRETRAGDDRQQQHAFYFGTDVHGVTMAGNVMEGHPLAAVVDDTADPDNRLQATTVAAA